MQDRQLEWSLFIDVGSAVELSSGKPCRNRRSKRDGLPSCVSRHLVSSKIHIAESSHPTIGMMQMCRTNT